MDAPLNDETYGGASDYASLWQMFEDAERYTDDLRKDGYRVAQWQTEYRKLVSLHTLEERTKGTPATVTSDIVRGMDDVIHAKQEWLCAEADQRADNHLVYLSEQKAGVLANIIKSEMFRPSNQ